MPHSFMRYWIDRFPRLLSHSYHALESCSPEPTFSCYYPSTCYVFSKPRYFYEETEDFKPFDTGSKSRDSPKRYYKPQNYPNFVMTRKPVQKSQNNYGMMNSGDITNQPTYTRASKKGAYNFHRSNDQNNYKPEQNENFKWAENTKENCTEVNVPVLNIRNTDFERKSVVKLDDSDKKGENLEKNKIEVKNNDNPKYDKSKKKPKPDATVSKEAEPVDEDGFTKVRHRGNSKKQKNNEQVTWIVPSQEKK